MPVFGRHRPEGRDPQIRVSAIVIGRSNSSRGCPSIDALVARLNAIGLATTTYESRLQRLRQSIIRSAGLTPARLPEETTGWGRWRRNLKLLGALMTRPRHWEWVVHRLILSRWLARLELRWFIRRTMMPNGGVLIGHSAGAVLAASVTDEPGVLAIIAFGYPFRHPERREEPYRTRHLASVAVPMLIVQGVSDPYGSAASGMRYPLSPSIEWMSVETDHDYGTQDAALLDAICNRACALATRVLAHEPIHPAS